LILVVLDVELFWCRSAIRAGDLWLIVRFDAGCTLRSSTPAAARKEARRDEEKKNGQHHVLQRNREILLVPPIFLLNSVVLAQPELSGLRLL
jgi:hypothetical protein